MLIHYTFVILYSSHPYILNTNTFDIFGCTKRKTAIRGSQPKKSSTILLHMYICTSTITHVFNELRNINSWTLILDTQRVRQVKSKQHRIDCSRECWRYLAGTWKCPYHCNLRIVYWVTLIGLSGGAYSENEWEVVVPFSYYFVILCICNLPSSSDISLIVSIFLGITLVIASVMDDLDLSGSREPSYLIWLSSINIWM